MISVNNSGYPSPLEIPCVALDLETTGLSSEQDEIIEVGAVKFIGDREISVFHSMVNPYRLIPPFVRQLTGISDDDHLIGHNYQSHLGTLKKRMTEAAGNLEFEEAAELDIQIQETLRSIARL